MWGEVRWWGGGGVGEEGGEEWGRRDSEDGRLSILYFIRKRCHIHIMYVQPYSTTTLPVCGWML